METLILTRSLYRTSSHVMLISLWMMPIGIAILFHFLFHNIRLARHEKNTCYIDIC